MYEKQCEKQVTKQELEKVVGKSRWEMGYQGNARQCSGRKYGQRTWKPAEGNGRLGYGKQDKVWAGMTRKCEVEQERQGNTGGG